MNEFYNKLEVLVKITQMETEKLIILLINLSCKWGRIMRTHFLQGFILRWNLTFFIMKIVKFCKIFYFSYTGFMATYIAGNLISLPPMYVTL